jgi:hypothetical protein
MSSGGDDINHHGSLDDFDLEMGEYYNYDDDDANISSTIHTEEEIDVVSISQIDIFLTNMYKYFIGRGFRNIIVTQIVNLLLVTFLVLFCIWLFSCLRFDLLMTFREPGQIHHISEIINWSGLSHMHWYLVICLILFCAFFVWKVVRIAYDTQKMREMQTFYNKYLNISDFELSTIRWQKVTECLQELQTRRPFYLGTDPLTLHNVTNRVLKKENYFVAMINKDIFDFSIPYLDVPFFTKTMEWNIQYAMINYLFDDRMKLKKEFMEYHNREELANGLQKRLTLMAVLNLLLMPFLGLFLIFWGVFERGQEFYKTPSKLSSRRWGHLAKWKFREFNELPHVFYERMKLSTKYADDYLSQFPNYWLSDIAKLGAFVVSTFLFIMFIGMIFNDLILFNLELGADRSVFWWMGVLSTALLVLRGFIKESYIFYPDKKIKKVAEYIHYIPEEWIDNASTYSTKSKFLHFYEYRVWVMFKELLGILVNPIMMLMRMRKDTLNLVDFVRDYTLLHPELGHVCKFSVFELGSDPMMNSQRLSQLNANCNQKKMEKSVYYFNQNLTPQQSLIDTSIFSSVLPHQSQYPIQNSIMQGTLQNMNEMSFAPSTQQQQQQSAMYGSIATGQFRQSPTSSVSNNQMMSQMRRPRIHPNTVTQNTQNTQNTQSIFLPPNVIGTTSAPGSNHNNVMFNSGDLIDDIEAANSLEESQKEPNMMDIFVGKNKK